MKTILFRAKQTLERHLFRSRPEEAAFLLFSLAALAILLHRGLNPAFLAREILAVALRLKFLWLALAVGTYLGLVWVVRAAVSRRKEDWIRAPASLWTALRDFSVFVMCLGVYSALKYMVPFLSPQDRDVALARLDLALFGVNPFVWVWKFQDPWLARFLAFSYGSYFWAAPLLAAGLYATGRRRHFRDMMLAVAFSSFLGYLGYLAVPAVSPQSVFAGLYHLPYHIALTADPAPHYVAGHLGLARDCFPSLHTAWTVIVLGAAFRAWRPIFWLYLPLGLGLVAATIYFGFHYAADLPAGLIVGLVGAALARRTNDLWEKRGGAA